eukprot:5388215-Alexandrium_andersonii.AAC.1
MPPHTTCAATCVAAFGAARAATCKPKAVPNTRNLLAWPTSGVLCGLPRDVHVDQRQACSNRRGGASAKCWKLLPA